MKHGRLDRYTPRIEKLGAAVILILTMLFMIYLTASAFLQTTDISIADPSGEYAEIYSDNIFLNLILVCIFLAALYIFYRHGTEIKLRRLEIALLCWTFILGAAFIASVKLRAPWYSDSFYVTYAAQRAAVGDYSALENYFVRFPFQLGYVLYSEIFFRVAGTLIPGLPDGYYCLALQGVNLLWLLLCYHALIRISLYIYSSMRIQKLTALLLFFCFPAVLSCTFLYGNIPAFSCGTVAVWMFLAYLNRKKLKYALVFAAAMTLAVILKLNLLIFALAIAIVWVFDVIRTRSVKSLICFVLAAACVLGLKGMPQRIYEARTGKDFGDGIPMIAWMAMGFSEGHAGPGWYKEDNTVKFFTHSGNDAEATAEHAKQVISERCAEFAADPGEALHFFSTKLRTQWNEPTYESVWINQVQQSYSEKGGLYELFCGRGEQFFGGVMNQFQQLIFFGVLLSLFELWRRRVMESSLLPLIILGGLLYHLLFEAKSQYALPYFVLMIPMAAFGFGWFFYRIENR